jgi:hypothetical protein
MAKFMATFKFQGEVGSKFTQDDIKVEVKQTVLCMLQALQRAAVSWPAKAWDYLFSGAATDAHIQRTLPMAVHGQIAWSEGVSCCMQTVQKISSILSLAYCRADVMSVCIAPNKKHHLQGHAIECRINAEEPFQNFRPGPGRVTTYLAPGGPHVRMDSHLYPDYLVPPNYDSLLGKLIVWGEDRNQVRIPSCNTHICLNSH